MNYQIKVLQNEDTALFLNYDYSNRDNCGKLYQTINNSWYNVYLYSVDMNFEEGRHNNKLDIYRIYNFHWLCCFKKIRDALSIEQKYTILDCCQMITNYTYNILNVDREEQQGRINAIINYIRGINVECDNKQYLLGALYIMFLSILGEKISQRYTVLTLPEEYCNNPNERFYDATVDLLTTDADINDIALNYCLMSDEFNIDENNLWNTEEFLWDNQQHISKREIEFTNRKSNNSSSFIGFGWGNKDSWAVHLYKIWKYNNEINTSKKILQDKEYFHSLTTYVDYVKQEYLTENNINDSREVVYNDVYNIYSRIRDIPLRTNGEDNKGNWIEDCLTDILLHYQNNRRHEIKNTLAIIYLAMLAEYRYCRRNNHGEFNHDINGDIQESRVGPKLKMLGIYRVLIDGMSPEDASIESYNLSPEDIANRCRTVGIEDFFNEH